MEMQVTGIEMRTVTVETEGQYLLRSSRTRLRVILRRIYFTCIALIIPIAIINPVIATLLLLPFPVMIICALIRKYRRTKFYNVERIVKF